VAVIAAIIMDGVKLPLTIIGKGKTLRCLVGSKLPMCVDRDFSLSGRINTNLMCRYLHRQQSTQFSDHEPLTKDSEISALSESGKDGQTSGDYCFEDCCRTQSKGRGGNSAVSSRKQKTSIFEKGGISAWDRTEAISRSEYAAVALSNRAI
jgi:hypothetical protein